MLQKNEDLLEETVNDCSSGVAENWSRAIRRQSETRDMLNETRL